MSFKSDSYQASISRAQGLDRDAELYEHFMRSDLADMYGGDAARDYKSESRMYYEAKIQGRDRDAEIHKRHMDAAMIKMMESR